MSNAQQSNTALNRSLGQWFDRIRAGQLKLPRFQRFEAWDRSRVKGFLNTVIHNLPVGITLLLEVGDKEKFDSRYIATAPGTGATVTEHLLDGQQRLTAFWRAMHNNYEGETYFVYLPQFDHLDTDNHDAGEMYVEFVARWQHKGSWRPVWAASPRQCLERGLLPVNLLCPGDLGKTIDDWIETATVHREPAETDGDALRLYKALEAERKQLRDVIATLRERVAHFNLPYLALPASTDANMALTVFVNMNTNSKPLSMFDLTVAMVEEEAGASLHALQEQLESRHPEITRYGDMSSTLLQTGALLQEKTPNKTGIDSADKQELVNDWPRIGRAMVRTADFLARQHIYDEQRLPSNVVLPVLAACFDCIPETGDAVGRGERLLRAYLWSACFTTRYEGAAATRSFQDCKALVALLKREHFGPADYSSIPVLNRIDYPLPTHEQLVRVGWPRGADRIARSILDATLYFGGWDFADGQPASFDSLRTREYHHIFPDALLKDAGMESYLGLNCALITAKTNRVIGRKDPLSYLRDRVQWADELAVRQRLATHLIDYDILAMATYTDGNGNPLEGEPLTAKLKPDFENFLKQRALLVSAMAQQLADGLQPSHESVIAQARDFSNELPAD